MNDVPSGYRRQLELPSPSVALTAFQHLTLTYDLDLQSPVSHGHDLVTRKKIKVKGQFVQKI